MPEEEEITTQWFHYDVNGIFTSIFGQNPMSKPELSPQRKLLRDRVRLIRSLKVSNDGLAKSFTELEALLHLGKIIRQDKDNHFLSFSQEDKGMVSFASKSQHKFDNEKRYKTTLGRYIRKQLNIDSETISDRTLETLGYAVNGELVEPDDLPIRVVNGKDITEAYKNHLGNETCMTGGCKSSIVKIYEMNPDKVSLVIYDDRARALLWTTDNDVKVLDRIYPNEGVHVRAMHKWAKSKGYVIRPHNHLPNGDDEIVLSDEHQHYVTLTHEDRFPFMDTFLFGQITDGHVKLSNVRMSDDDVILLECDGNYGGVQECCNCEEHIPEGSEYQVGGDIYCEDCYSDSFYCCDYCGESVSRDETTQVDGEEYYCEHCLDRHTTQCGYCGNYFTDNVSHAEDTDKYYCESCAMNNIGLTECPDCNQLVEETDIGEDDTYRCNECHQEYEESINEPATA